MSNIRFTRASVAGQDSLQLEVDAEIAQVFHNIAAIVFENEQWEVVISTINGQVVRLKWSDFARIFEQFSTFIAEESANLLKEQTHSKE